MIPKRSICVGDVVLLQDKSVKRKQWLLARVQEVKKSGDGLVRTATVVVVTKCFVNNTAKNIGFIKKKFNEIGFLGRVHIGSFSLF